ncbi:MAG: DM13 domain-containing protein [Nanoarchaeota archaeon]|nr:DM13 domain-containing protein [Nanoarchaeota archaeon]
MKKSYVWGIIVLGILIFVVGWWFASPLFIDKKVDEEGIGGDNVYFGNFIDADDFHMTKGEAMVLEDGSGRYLRFENFEATNGPDLKVYLSTDLEASDYVSLGDLKGNIGNQNYEIPEGTDLEKYNNVLVWCEAFGVLFGSADLEGAS